MYNFNINDKIKSPIVFYYIGKEPFCNLHIYSMRKEDAYYYTRAFVIGASQLYDFIDNNFVCKYFKNSMYLSENKLFFWDISIVMDLNEYIPVINNTIKFYVNERGLITHASEWHLAVMQLALLYHWDRFVDVVGHARLWTIFLNLNNEDKLHFHANGKPFKPPAGLALLVACEQEKHLVEYFQSQSIGVTTILAILFMIILAAQIVYNLLDVPQLVREALTLNILKQWFIYIRGIFSRREFFEHLEKK